MLSIEDQISLLLWDRRIIIVADQHFYIRNIPISVRNKALALKEQVYARAISEGVASESQMIQDAIETEILPEDYQIVLNKATENINLLSDSLKNQKNIVKRKKIEAELKLMRAEYDKIIENKSKLYINSADYLGNEAYIYNLMMYAILNENEEVLWPNIATLYNTRQSNPQLFNELITSFVSSNIWAIKLIRQVARSFEWRLLWSLCKENLSQLFDCPISAFNTNQKMLIYWSKVYDSVYEDINKPEDEIIQDDDMLDNWLIERHGGESKIKNPTGDHHEQMVILDGYYSEKCICGIASVKVKGHGERPRHREDCKHGTWVQYTAEEKDKMAQQFYGKNPSNIRQLLDKEHDVVAQKGTIEEQHLRKGKNRYLLGLEQKKVK